MYRGIMETDTIKQVETKEGITKEYIRQTRILIESKFCCRNLIKEMNMWAVSPPDKMYRTILKIEKTGIQRNRPEDKKIDINAQDHTTERWYTHKEGRRALASIEESADASIRRFEDNIKTAKKNYGQRPITAVTTSGLTEQQNLSNINGKKNKLYGYSKRQIGELSDEKI